MGQRDFFFVGVVEFFGKGGACWDGKLEGSFRLNSVARTHPKGSF